MGKNPSYDLVCPVCKARIRTFGQLVIHIVKRHPLFPKPKQ